jgi:hypothetical protein
LEVVVSVYATGSLVLEAYELVLPAITQTMRTGVAKRSDGCLRVSVKQSEGDWKNVLVKHFGDRDKWDHGYNVVAASKEEISIRTGLTSREIQMMHPELVEPGDTVYYGNAMSPTIIVSFSGVEAYFDEMFCKWLLAAILALIQHELEQQKAASKEFYAE